jgi:hypothetical protein
MNGKYLALGAICAMSALVSSVDVAVAAMPHRGGESFTAKVIEQIDNRTFRVDLGPPKVGVVRGIVTVRADRATRFTLATGTMSAPTLYGSLGTLRIGPTVPVVVMLGPALPDGSYRLLDLKTTTR